MEEIDFVGGSKFWDNFLSDSFIIWKKILEKFYKFPFFNHRIFGFIFKKFTFNYGIYYFKII
ncbi:MAG: hypothetical protein CM1200mP31_0700 [Candidatus Neomarinimicrobiota bacterium]|nr:MAG: hypothetical protein CM1200mP31_0700 [Candidatus Neomarinimicrobiota bacterium]